MIDATGKGVEESRQRGWLGRIEGSVVCAPMSRAASSSVAGYDL